jgi:hypothetical protein
MIEKHLVNMPKDREVVDYCLRRIKKFAVAPFEPDEE